MKKKVIGIALIIVIGLSIFFIVGRKSEETQPVMAYVEAEGVSETESPSSAPTSEPTIAPTSTQAPTPVPTAEPDIIEVDKTMYANADVNLREGNGTEFAKVGSLSLNEEVHVIGQSKSTNWYMLEQGAFVSDKYLSDAKTEVAEVPVEKPKPASTPAPQQSSVGSSQSGQDFLNSIGAGSLDDMTEGQAGDGISSGSSGISFQ